MRELAFAADLDQPGILQFLHVMGERGRSDVVARLQRAAGCGAVTGADLLEDIHPARLSQRLGDQFELAGGEGGFGHAMKMTPGEGGYKWAQPARLPGASMANRRQR